MSIYEEVEIEDLDFDPKTQVYTYPCPCGDRFRISLEDMWEVGEDIATCPSCTLQIMIIYEEEDLPALREDDDDEAEEKKGDSVKGTGKKAEDEIVGKVEKVSLTEIETKA